MSLDDSHIRHSARSGHLWAHGHHLAPHSPKLIQRSSSGGTTPCTMSPTGSRARLHFRQQSDCPVSPVLLRRHLQPDLLSPRMARKKAWYESTCHSSGGRRGLPNYLSLNLPHGDNLANSDTKSQSTDCVVDRHKVSPSKHPATAGLILKTVHRSWPSTMSKDHSLKR